MGKKAFGKSLGIFEKVWIWFSKGVKKWKKFDFFEILPDFLKISLIFSFSKPIFSVFFILKTPKSIFFNNVNYTLLVFWGFCADSRAVLRLFSPYFPKTFKGLTISRCKKEGHKKCDPSAEKNLYFFDLIFRVIFCTTLVSEVKVQSKGTPAY